MRMGQGVRTGLGHGGITCVLQTQFSSFYIFSMCFFFNHLHAFLYTRLKNGHIKLYSLVSVCLSVRPSVNFFVSI